MKSLKNWKNKQQQQKTTTTTKKPLGNIIILHMYTINDNHILHSSWDIEHYGQTFYHEGAKIFKNGNISWKYDHFTLVHQKLQSYDVWFLRYEVRQTAIFAIFGYFLPFYYPRPLMIRKIKILKKKKKRKKCREILSFYAYMCTLNEDHMIYGSWNIRCDR